MRLLVTRPVEDAERQAAKLEALGHQVLIRPLLEIEYPPLTPLRLVGVQALVVTSVNALRGLARNASFEAATRLPVYCVGAATAEFARHLGFGHVISGSGTAKDLVPLITHTVRPNSGALLYMTGRQVSFDLETPLKSSGFEIPRLIVYEAQETGEQETARFAEAIRAGVDGVLLMSPRTAKIFVSLLKSFQLEREVRATTCYCYSEAISKPLGEIDGLTIAISSHPTEAEFIKLIGPAQFRSAAFADLKEALGKH